MEMVSAKAILYKNKNTESLLSIDEREKPVSLQKGTPLPSIRALAKDLHVSIITTKRAYEELEAMGLIDTLVGKGTFVSAKPIGQVKEAAILHLEEKISAIIVQAKTLGLSKEELMTLFSTLYEEEL